jgi:hypothetical protein
MICNWCGDTIKEGIYEIHKCLTIGEEIERESE